MADIVAAAERPDAPTLAAVRAILAAAPIGCTFLVPLTTDGVPQKAGAVVDYRIEATTDAPEDLHGRGGSRIGSSLADLYPGMVGDPLWQLYAEVLATGRPGQLDDYAYEEKATGVVAHSRFSVTVQPAFGGLLVWWRRLDEDQRRWAGAEALGGLGWSVYDLVTGRSVWSPGMYRLFERDPALGPLSRAEQSRALLEEDRGISETAWQTLDTGGVTDVTARFHCGDQVKHLRIVADVARDADGAPLKIYAMVQDVTTAVTSRTALDLLADQLRTRETTALAEHRLAAQLQNLIQPVPREPVRLAGLDAVVGYLPAESTTQVGGDWYHAQTLPDGRTLLVIGDVAGHGLAAAAGMAHLRFALIAWLSIGIDDPGLLLSHLNRLCVQLRITGTALIAVYGPDGRLTWCRAGHPPPLLAREGTAEPLAMQPGLLLGADENVTFPAAEATLLPGDLLLLYTDGLVERRGRPDQLDRVRAGLVEAVATRGDAGLLAVQESLAQASPDDDICFIAARILG